MKKRAYTILFSILLMHSIESSSVVTMHDQQLMVQAMTDHLSLDLIDAAHHNALKSLQTLLAIPEIKVNITHPDTGRTALMIAAESGHVPIVEALLSMPTIDINAFDQQGNTALTLAVRQNHPHVVQLLVQNKSLAVNATHSYDGKTPLIIAAEKGYTSIAALLLNHQNIDVTLLDNIFEQTAYRRAINNGHSDMVRLFLSSGKIDINEPEYHTSPLVSAFMNNHHAVFMLLLTHPDRAINGHDAQGKTPLWRAVDRLNEEAVRELINQKDILINQETLAGETPLTHALSRSNWPMVDLLRTHPALIVDLPGIQDFFNRSLEQGMITTALSLLSFEGIDINRVTQSGQTPLMIALKNSKFTQRDAAHTFIRTLLALPRLTINAIDVTGNSALIWAVASVHGLRENHIKEIGGVRFFDGLSDGTKQALLKSTLDPRIQIIQEMLALPHLILNGANARGDTALMIAARYGLDEVVRLLLDTNLVETYQSNAQGLTATLIAQEGGHHTIAAMITAYEEKHYIPILIKSATKQGSTMQENHR